MGSPGPARSTLVTAAQLNASAPVAAGGPKRVAWRSIERRLPAPPWRLEAAGLGDMVTMPLRIPPAFKTPLANLIAMSSKDRQQLTEIIRAVPPGQDRPTVLDFPGASANNARR